MDEAPDPDEDYLDDLDDVLDEFSAPTAPRPPSPSHGATVRVGRQSEHQHQHESDQADDAERDDELTKRLEAGMAELLDELVDTPEMRQQLETLVKDLGQSAAATDDAASVPATDRSPSATTTTADAARSFQDGIRRTMQRMQESNRQATSAAAAHASPDGDDLLAEMLRQFPSAGAGRSGGGGEHDDGHPTEDELSKLMVDMMEQLTTKDILYQPMLDLHQRFPAWLAQHQSDRAVEDDGRYREQQTLVGEIVRRFEQPDYSDDRPVDREYIIERMQKMQAAGAPPADLIGQLTPDHGDVHPEGADADAAAAAAALTDLDLDASCPPQ